MSALCQEKKHDWRGFPVIIWEQKRLFGVRRVISRRIAANFAAERISLKNRD
jgi:hypothetical protein